MIRVAFTLVLLTASPGAGLAAQSKAAPSQPAARPPNFIVFFTDDQGYGDVGCYGAKDIATPHLDRMARDGMRLTSFYAQNVCGPSRAALMTGCYPIRCGEPGNRKHPHTVLHPEETTIAEVLRARGYRTACIGKWHLAGGGTGRGRGPFAKARMPLAQGFDEFFGTPLYNGTTREVDPKFRIELYRGDAVVDPNADNDQLTQRLTAESVAFLQRNQDQPFFLYLAHNMPHVPLGVSKAFRGKSGRGRYGDVIMELDWSMGRILATLRELGIDEQTLVVFTSDNGPWVERQIGDAGGSAGPLRGFKMNTWEGGHRVPGIVRWPGRVPAGGTSDAIVTTMDLLPTFAKLAGAPLPEHRIDGVDVWPTFARGETVRSHYLYYCFTHLQAVRDGDWKLVLPRPAKPPWTSWYGRMVDAVAAPELYDLREDPGETHDLADHATAHVARLMTRVQLARTRLGDYDRVGSEARFFDPGEKRPGVARWRPRPPHLDRPVGGLRFDFEKGEADGWEVVEGKLGAIVSEAVSLPKWRHQPFRKQGRFHVSTIATADAAGERVDDGLQGVLQSPAFVLEGGKMSFLVGGGAGPRTYVALCTPAGKELLRAHGTDGPSMRRVLWDVRAYVGRTLCLRIVDRKTRGWAHVTFDDFSCEGELVK